MKTPVSVLLKTKGADVVTIAPTAQAFEAIQRMADKHVGCVVVTDQDGKPVGIVSERDCFRKVVLAEKSPHKITVADIMSANLTTMPPERTVEECMELMTEKRIRHLPVLERGALCGIISIGDCVKFMVTEQDQMIHNLEKYIEGSL